MTTVRRPIDDLPPESVQRALRVQRERDLADLPPDDPWHDFWVAIGAVAVLLVVYALASVMPAVPS